MMKQMISGLIATLLLTSLLKAENLPSWLKTNDKGVIQIEEAQLEVFNFLPDWNLATQGEISQVKVEKNAEKATFNGAFLGGNLAVTATGISPDSFGYQAQFSSAAPVKSKGLLLALTLPLKNMEIFASNGKNIKITENFAKDHAQFYIDHPGKFTITLDGNKTLAIEGTDGITVVDQRLYNRKSVQVHIYFTPRNGDLTNSALSLTISLK